MPAELERIITKALEKDCRLRYQTASDLRSDLARLKRDSDSHPVEARVDVARGGVQRLRIIRPWEAVARDGREFARQGVGIMYWFRVPLGGICHPGGFRNSLQPALDNPRISTVRFVLDSSAPAGQQAWDGLVIPLLHAWAKRSDREIALDRHDDGGRLVEQVEGTTLLTWVATDLSEEFSPSFKLLVDDPDMDELGESQAQIFLSTVTRNVRLSDGTRRTIRIPTPFCECGHQKTKACCTPSAASRINGTLSNRWPDARWRRANEVARRTARRRLSYRSTSLDSGLVSGRLRIVSWSRSRIFGSSPCSRHRLRAAVPMARIWAA